MVSGEGIIFSLYNGMLEWLFESLTVGGEFHEIKGGDMCCIVEV